jgi:ABC-type multidrug transport system fused ATPase/permease subunit
MIPIVVWIMTIHGDASVASLAGVVSMLILAAWRILPMVNRSLSVLIVLRGIRPSFLQALSVFEETQKLPTVELPEPDPDYTFENTLCLESVSFKYPKNKEYSLHDVSLCISKGWQVGIIGLSGAGKSTLAGVLSGLFEPDSGKMLVDGIPLDPSRKSAYMQRVGYVPQTPYIMAGTIADNVAFSQWGRPYDRDRVLRACRMASLDMVNVGKGIDTVLGANGAGLSGGQAQRVSIARALFCNPDLLIFDESTSSLDQKNEDAIINGLDIFKGTVTVILIAHRLTTLERCDRIYWFDKGRLVDEGPVATILGRYRHSMRTADERTN